MKQISVIALCAMLGSGSISSAQAPTQPYYVDYTRYLTYEKVLEELPGRWTTRKVDPVTGRGSWDCDTAAFQIFIERPADGPATFRYYLESSQATTSGPIIIEKGVFGSPKRQIRVRFRDPEQQPPEGDGAEWVDGAERVIVMPDELTFLWRNETWPKNAFSQPSRRCKAPASQPPPPAN